MLGATLMLGVCGVLAFAVVGINTESVGVDGCDSSSNAFDYMLHVQQWDAAFGKPTTYTTMHGMWPSREGADESYPCTCTTEPFSEPAVHALIPDMNKYWPSLEGTNDPFWTHEWTKHGTCAGLASQPAFFNTTLQWRAKIDVYGALQKAGITPGNSYAASKYDDAFKDSCGVTALLGCGDGGAADSNVVQTFAFCINKDATQLKECDATVKSGSGGVVSCDRTKDIVFTDGSGPSPGPPGPAPPGPPSPNGDECVPNAHGPKCSSDSDCLKVPHCVRCAHSGYCTEEPKIPSFTEE